MSAAVEPLIVSDAGRATDGWNEPQGRGVIGWQTLLSADETPSDALTAGIAIVEPGGFLARHRHAPAELSPPPCFRWSPSPVNDP